MAAKTLYVSFVLSHDQLVDILIKPISLALLVLLRSSFTTIILPMPLELSEDARTDGDLVDSLLTNSAQQGTTT